MPTFAKGYSLFRKWISGLLIVSMAVALAGCFDTTNNNQPGLSANPSNINIAVGSTLELIIHNNNGTAINGITITPSANLSGLAVYGNCATLPAGGQCMLRVTAKLDAALRTGDLAVNSQNTSTLSIPIQVTLPVNSSLSLNKSMLALYQNAGADTLMLTNNGNVNLTGIALNDLPAGVTANGDCSTLAPGEQCAFTFTADNSSTSGTYNATLSAFEISPLQLVVQVSPENQGPAATTLAIVNPSANGLFITAGSSAAILLQNTGAYPINGSLLYNSGVNSSYISVNSDSCTNLAADSTCIVNIATASATPNHTSGSITFTANNVNNLDPSVATTMIHIGSPGLQLNASAFSIAQAGTLTVTVTNNGYAASNVRLSGLPEGVTTDSTCAVLPHNGSCNFMLKASNTVTSGESTVNVLDDQGDSLPFTLNVEQIGLSSNDVNGQNIIYVPVGGKSNSITIQNMSMNFSADNVTVRGLPAGVTATSCDTILPQGSCEITLSAAGNISPGSTSVPITIQGDNTLSLSGYILVEQPSLSITYGGSSNITFSSFGDATLTVTNNSHFEVNDVVPSVSDSSGQMTLDSANNNCNTLAALMSCTFEVNVTANATTTSDPAVTVTGQLASPNNIPVQQTVPIALAGPAVTINNNTPIVIPGAEGNVILIPVTVTGFNIQSPQLNLSLGDNQNNLSASLQDAGNPANPCSNPYTVGSNCVIAISNTADLDISGDNDNGTVSINGTNLNTPVTQQVSVAGGLVINYISLSDVNAGTYYSSTITGPRYGVILVKNLSATDSYILNTLSFSPDTDPSFAIDSAGSDYGSNTPCTVSTTLASNASCIIILQATSTKSVGTVTGSLRISATNNNAAITTSRSFNLTNITYLYAGGNFSSPGAAVVKWDGNNWSPLGSGANNWVLALTTDNAGNLYIGGSFTSPGPRVAKWNGSNWSALGSGTSSLVRTLAMDNAGNLYAGGDFNSPGAYAAKWNGSSWSALGSGTNGPVYTLLMDNSSGNLYAGGGFTAPGSRVAKWDGSSWSALGSGTNNSVEALVTDSARNILYAGGNFILPGSRIAKWDGSNWSALGSGMTGGSVYALTMDNEGNLYAGGVFSSPGPYVAEWNGSSWSALGSGINGSIKKLVMDGEGNLYAGGAFTSPGAYVAKWDGNSWSALGSGMNAAINSLAIGNVLQVQ